MAFTVTDRFSVRFGGNTYINCGTLLTYNDAPLFDLKRHEDGYLGIYFDLHDFNGVKLAVVKRNKLYPTAALDTDRFQEAGTQDAYQLIDRSTNVAVVDIRKRGAAVPHELDVSVKLHASDGFLVDATPTMTNLEGITMIGNVLQGCQVGIAIHNRGGHAGVGICAGAA